MSARTCAHCGCNLRREKVWPEHLCDPCEKKEQEAEQESTRRRSADGPVGKQRRREILALLEGAGEMSNREVADRIGQSTESTVHHLKRLADEGTVARRPYVPDGGGHGFLYSAVVDCEALMSEPAA